MNAAKVEVALGRHIGDVGRDAARLAQLVDIGGGDGIVDCGEDHGDGRVVKVAGDKLAVDVDYLGALDAVCYFGIETVAGRDDGYQCVSVEAIEDAACCDLEYGLLVLSKIKRGSEGRGKESLPRRRQLRRLFCLLSATRGSGYRRLAPQETRFPAHP